MKLSKRLQCIVEQVHQPYTHIWDCCCDHGQLGFALLKNKNARKVHFIDIVESLMLKLKGNIQRYYLGSADDWQVHCINVNQLPLNNYQQSASQDTHLIIIAGVGGLLLKELLCALIPLNEKYHLEFLICPVHHNFLVRDLLIKNKFKLINEVLVFDQGRYYEILHVSTHASQTLVNVGSNMWDFSLPMHHDYLKRNIAHYQRMQKSMGEDVKEIINAYQALMI